MGAALLVGGGAVGLSNLRGGDSPEEPSASQSQQEEVVQTVEDTSFGILTVTPRDAQGNPIAVEQLEDYILHDAQGAEVKEWQAVAGYLQSMGGEMDPKYGQTDGRKYVYASWNPVSLLKNAGLPTAVAILALVLVLVLLIVVVLLVRKRILRRVRKNPYPAGEKM